MHSLRLLTLAACLLACSSLRPPQPLREGWSRRATLSHSLMGAFALLPSPPAHAISVYAKGSEERCENGEGGACERLAGESELIKRLQEQSKKNRARNEQDLYDKTVRNLQYSDYFDALEKNLVQLPNNSYVTLDMETYSQLRKEGRIQPGSVDRLLPEGSQPRAAFLQAASDPDYVCSRGLDCRAREGGSLAYSSFKSALKAKQVKNVAFTSTEDDVVLALLSGSDDPVKVDVKGWKKAEMLNLLKRQGVPNNFAELQ